MIMKTELELEFRAGSIKLTNDNSGRSVLIEIEPKLNDDDDYKQPIDNQIRLRSYELAEFRKALEFLEQD